MWSEMGKQNVQAKEVYYRSISILPVISKLAEKAVNVQLQQYFNTSTWPIKFVSIGV